MKFDSILTFLMPKNDKFFAFFEQTAVNFVETTELLKLLPGTPEADREDIHRLASSLDDILDNIYGAVVRFELYRIKDVSADMMKLIEILDRSARELHKGIYMVRDLHKRDEVGEVLKKVRECENEADTAFEEAVAALFEHDKDPINIIKLKEIYVGLETATDKCEDAANVIEGLLIKHS